jgi:DNA invertase Pin-like site-specific DNA recombinase
VPSTPPAGNAIYRGDPSCRCHAAAPGFVPVPSAAGRDGFQSLTAQVGLGQAGAVLSLRACRPARSCSDWYRLREVCALTDTPAIDEDGVHDPSQYADRLLPGILGTVGEAVRHRLRNRLLGGKLARAGRGELWMRPPGVGLLEDSWSVGQRD